MDIVFLGAGRLETGSPRETNDRTIRVGIVYRGCEQLPRSQPREFHRPYFLANSVASAVAVCPLALPPRITCPAGVAGSPPQSMRGSTVFSSAVTHWLACRS